MTVNPIRKRRGQLMVVAGTGEKIRARGAWYAICPDCGDRVAVVQCTWVATTRKQAKDALLFHHTRKHAEPGGYRSELDAEAARRSP